MLWLCAHLQLDEAVIDVQGSDDDGWMHIQVGPLQMGMH